MQQLLGPLLQHLPAAQAAYLTGREFFPALISRRSATASTWRSTSRSALPDRGRGLVVPRRPLRPRRARADARRSSPGRRAGAGRRRRLTPRGARESLRQSGALALTAPGGRTMAPASSLAATLTGTVLHRRRGLRRRPQGAQRPRRPPAGAHRPLPDTADVAAAVRRAPRAGLEISVRGGGHNVAGRAVVDGGADDRPRRDARDRRRPGGATATAQGGATWGDAQRRGRRARPGRRPAARSRRPASRASRSAAGWAG